ncbi:MAG: DUF6240 domain-containing protein [Lachnospiraceae bacterium]|nr:DUF6240 domain-containing protein [Lachnospiraceae bacterium]
MRINFDTDHSTNKISANDGFHNEKINDRIQKGTESALNSGFLVSVGQESALPVAGGGKEKEPMTDFAANLQATDVSLKTDYMSVMSLSMSDEDYSELVRTGQEPEDMDATDSVTILDEIKAAVIKGGTNVSGYTDKIDPGTLAEITGSETAASALIKKASDAGLETTELAKTMQEQDLTVNAENISRITDTTEMLKDVLPLSDTGAAYIVQTGKAPTVENIYQASHSGYLDARGGRRYYSEGGYVSESAGLDDIEELRPQIEDTIKKAGLEINDKTLADAKLLISNGIPFTSETLLSLDSLSDLRSTYDPATVAKSVSIAISAGIPESKANLTYTESIYIQAEDLVKEVKSIPDEAADEVVSAGEMLNIRNLRIAAERINTQDGLKTGTTQVPVINDAQSMSAEQIHARRILEEVRITMTVDANRMLYRSNFQIDIAPMEELVDALKAAEEAISSRLFPDEDQTVSNNRMSVYSDVRNELNSIPSAPAAILGQINSFGGFRFAATEIYTLHEVYEAGVSRRDAYIRAGETYEALMTAPRADMGDTIRKAFANVDDILNELRIETDDLNRRAVRILGYNSIEITPERIEQVREADVTLRNVINRLTPDKVINMIREDVNPLNMPIQELGEYLDGQDSEPERQARDYARFLMQLERQNEITELERDSYIGIYRMISSLDRTDDAAVGKLLEMGTQMSFANLLSAMRSTVKSGMDYSVGDDFGGVESLREGAAIDDQISAAFTTGKFAESARVNETVIENLLQSGEKVSVSNVEAMNALKNKRGDWVRALKDIKNSVTSSIGSDGSETKEDIADIDTAVDGVLERMTDTASAQEAYTSMLDAVKSDISDVLFGFNRYADVQTMVSSMRQIGLLNSFSQDEIYDLPADIDGELTSIRLTIRHESGAGRVAVSMTTEVLGNIAAEFTLRGGASGYIAYEKDEAKDRLNDMLDSLVEELGFVPGLIRTDRINLDKYTDGFLNPEKNKNEAGNEIKNQTEESDINNIELYKTARNFISALKAI